MCHFGWPPFDIFPLEILFHQCKTSLVSRRKTVTSYYQRCVRSSVSSVLDVFSIACLNRISRWWCRINRLIRLKQPIVDDSLTLLSHLQHNLLRCQSPYPLLATTCTITFFAHYYRLWFLPSVTICYRNDDWCHGDLCHWSIFSIIWSTFSGIGWPERDAFCTSKLSKRKRPNYCCATRTNTASFS